MQTYTCYGGPDERMHHRMDDWANLQALPFKNRVVSLQGQKRSSTFHIQILKLAGREDTSGKTNFNIVDGVYDRQLELHCGSVNIVSRVYLTVDQGTSPSSLCPRPVTQNSFNIFSDHSHLLRSHLKWGIHQSLQSRNRLRNLTAWANGRALLLRNRSGKVNQQIMWNTQWVFAAKKCVKQSIGDCI